MLFLIFVLNYGIVGICIGWCTQSASKQGLELIPLDLELEKIVREKKKQTVIDECEKHMFLALYFIAS